MLRDIFRFNQFANGRLGMFCFMISSPDMEEKVICSVQVDEILKERVGIEQKSTYGSLEKYADQSLFSKEKGMYERVMIDIGGVIDINTGITRWLNTYREFDYHNRKVNIQFD